MKIEEVEPPAGFHPLGLNSIANPFVPGTGIRTTAACPIATGILPEVGIGFSSDTATQNLFLVMQVHPLSYTDPSTIAAHSEDT